MSSPPNEALQPGATIGVLGSGQLGRMFALEARRMGYRVHIYSPDTNTPAGVVADRETRAPYEDLDAVRAFAASVDVVTFEFENVLSATAETAGECAPVRPHGHVLHTTQNRLREKAFLSSAGVPLPEFRAIRSAEDLRAGIEALGCPCVLKTAGWGYDGKGQRAFREAPGADDIATAWGELNGEGVLEAFVDFTHEVSIVAARGIDGGFAHYGLFENLHTNHILDTTVSPARLPPEIERSAVEIAHGILESLNVVGVLCVEFFVTKNGTLLVNELAPRTHNSGHVTLDAHACSQFEQQVRAVCGLPLGDTRSLTPAAMANLLGGVWSDGEPDWRAALAVPGTKLHLYGKAKPRPGRKMGHITALAEDIESAFANARAARSALTGGN